MATSPSIFLADYHDPADARAVLHLLDAYASDRMGGGAPLPPAVRARLIPALAAMPGAFTLLAQQDGEPVGLANCFTGFSTFAARRLVNLHDLYVQPVWRGHGIAAALLQAVEQEARARDGCKITLEVLEGNTAAQAAYRRAGFVHPITDPSLGAPLFWQKLLGNA